MDQSSTAIFLLTAEWEDSARGHILRFFGHSPLIGAVEVVISSSPPVFFVNRKGILPSLPFAVDRKAVKLVSISGQAVDALYFAGQRQLKDAYRILHDAGVESFEADLHPCDRFLMERFINGAALLEGDPQKRGAVSVFTDPVIKPGEVEANFRICSLDIETGEGNKKLYSVACHVTKAGEKDLNRVFILGGSEGTLSEDVYVYVTEERLLRAFFKWFREADADIIIGWNVMGFDISFLDWKCRQLGIGLALARGARPVLITRRGARTFVNISGRVVLDGPELMRGAFYNFEDFRLETVARELLGEGKAIAPVEDKVSEIERMFKHDKAALAHYNLQDCVLVTRIFEATALMDLCVRRTQLSGMLLEHIGKSAAAFDHLYLPRFHRRGYVAPNVADVGQGAGAAGGFVLEPVPGVYDHVLVLDFKSLYPSIILTFSIDPLSRMLADINTVKTPEGYRFSATEHILPGFIEGLLEQRAGAKQKGDKHLSQAIKILMNSFYGLMGSPGCRFYHPSLPSAITGTGQWLLKRSQLYLEQKGYRVLYGDTDSLFVMAGDVSAEVVAAVSEPERQGDKVYHELGRTLAGDLNAYWNKELKLVFGVESRLEMEFEKYYKRFHLPSARGREGGAKKRYAGLEVKEGRETLCFTGMESVRSDWTPLAKDFQQELYQLFFHHGEVAAYIRSFVTRVKRGELNNMLVYHKRLRKNLNEYEKNTPPQVRAARMLSKPGRDVRYVMTKRGPVPIQLPHTDIDYSHYLEKQLKPIADSVLETLGITFDSLLSGAQLGLFE